MSKDKNISKRADGSPSPRPRGPWTTSKVVNSVLAGVGTLFLSTHSIAVTITGAVLAVVVVTFYRFTHR